MEHQTTTNSHGRYQLKDLPPGEYSVSYSKENYIGRSEIVKLVGSVANEKNISLEPGEVDFSVSAPEINASVVKGEILLNIESNAVWAATTSGDWLSLQQDSKIGTGSIKVLWSSNEDGLEDRTATISIKAGNVEKLLHVFQANGSRIIKVQGIAGEILSGTNSQVAIQFNGAVSVKKITSLFYNCQGEISEPSYNNSRDLATFTFSCGGLGFSYPFHIEWEDQHGNSFIGEFRADFFTKSLEIQGMIVSRFNVPGENAQWILTKDPGKIYEIDLSTLTILQEFSWPHQSIYDGVITLNPFNRLLYIGGLDEISIIDPKTGNLNRSVELPQVPNRPSSQYRIVELAFNKAGYGIFVTLETESSGSDWFIIDASNDHQIFDHLRKGWENDQYSHVESLKASNDQNNLFLYASGTSTFGLKKATGNLESLSFVHAFDHGTPLNRMVYHRLEERMIFAHQSDIRVFDKQELFELGHIAYNFTADFAYNLGFHFYLVAENTNELQLIDYRKGKLEKKFPISGRWRDIVITLDGQYLIAEKDNYGYDTAENTFSTYLIQFPTTMFY